MIKNMKLSQRSGASILKYLDVISPYARAQKEIKAINMLMLQGLSAMVMKLKINAISLTSDIVVVYRKFIF